MNTNTPCSITLLVICSTISLTGCNQSSQSSNDIGMLKRVSQSQELVDTVHSGLTNTAINEVFINTTEANQAVSDTSTSSFTTTYTVDSDVDEYDWVKYNGEYLFIASQSPISVANDLVPAAANKPTVQILATHTDTATVTAISEIEMAENDPIRGLYLVDADLAVIKSSHNYGAYGSAWFNSQLWAEQSSILQIYNIDDIESPELTSDIRVQGSLVNSRRVDNVLYLITRHTPSIELDQNGDTTTPVNIEHIVPQLTINGVSSPLFTATDCYIDNPLTSTHAQTRYSATITSITVIPIDHPDTLKTICYNSSTSGVYLSNNAIYLIDVHYSEDEGNTRVHKFSTQGISMQYQGSAEVAGYLWTGNQRDFRINEYKGYLRLVTTLYTHDSNDREDHYVHILGEASETLQLEHIAQLPNPTRPNEIGKPNESLYGVRFFGDRAYIVTFERQDPLYVLDLSDINDPFIAGALDIPGFSDFLHPVNDNLLLGLGTSSNWDGRVKLELFNVANIHEPVSLATEFIGEIGTTSWSEAQHNRHAFTYLKDIDGTDRIGVPARIVDSNTNRPYEPELHLFEIANQDTPDNATLNSVGHIRTLEQSNSRFISTRSIFHGDAIFYITDNSQVWSAQWDNTEQVNNFQ